MPFNVGVGNWGRQHKVDRAPINPMDRSTVISIFPQKIGPERKLTITPGVFTVPPGSMDNPGILILGSSSWWRDFDPDQPPLEIVVYSTVVADSIVRDYVNGLVGWEPESSSPGLFFVPGCKVGTDGEPSETLTREWVKTDYAHLLERAYHRQRNWYQRVVEMADIDWSRTNGNPLAVNNLSRLAAQELQVAATKPWMSDFNTMAMKNCPACGHLRNNDYPICANCKTILDPTRFKNLGLQLAP